MRIEPDKKIADLTVAEFEAMVRQGLFKAVMWWLLLWLGIPAAAFLALIAFYFAAKTVGG